VKEDAAVYEFEKIDFDPDSDFAPEETNPNERLHWTPILRASDLWWMARI